MGEEPEGLWLSRDGITSQSIQPVDKSVTAGPVGQTSSKGQGLLEPQLGLSICYHQTQTSLDLGLFSPCLRKHSQPWHLEAGRTELLGRKKPSSILITNPYLELAFALCILTHVMLLTTWT